MNNNDLKRWIKSLVISFFVFALLSFYLYTRRGYYNIYIVNKVFGSEAAILAGFTLLIGPLSKRFATLTSYVTIRRHVGLVAFGLAILHISFSLFQTQRFEWFSWYLEEWIPVAFGILAILVWGYMTYISRNKKIQQLGVEVWKKRLSIAGQIGFVAIFLHLTTMKYPGWIRWLQGQVKQTPELVNPNFPPASLLVLLLMIFVIMYRVVIHFKHGKKDA